MDEDEAEMARLRKSKKFVNHQQKMKSRHDRAQKRAEIRQINQKIREENPRPERKEPEIDEKKLQAFKIQLEEEEAERQKRSQQLRGMLPTEFNQDWLDRTRMNQAKVGSHDSLRVGVPQKRKDSEAQKWLSQGAPKVTTECANKFAGVQEKDGSDILQKALDAIHQQIEYEGISAPTTKEMHLIAKELDDLKSYYNFLLKRIVDKETGTAMETGEDDEENNFQIDFEAMNRLKLPVSHKIVLKEHKKCVSAMSLDRSGSRLVTGSFDNDIRMWDFNSMREDLKSFRKFRPHSGHVILDVDYNRTGSQFFVVTGSATPKVYNRDAREIVRFCKGDMYIKDLTHTKGHVTECTGGRWHPKREDQVLSWGTDGTVRIWDLNGPTFEGTLLKCLQTVKTRALRAGRQQGGRLSITAAGCSKDFSTLVAGCNDGSLQWYDAKGNMKRGRIVEHAHDLGVNGHITSIAFEPSGVFCASRATDHTLKVWDKRKRKKPLAVFTDLPNDDPQTECIFSPDGKFILTGTSTAEDGVKGAKLGYIVWHERKTLKEVFRLPVARSSVVRLLQHPKLNQIFASCKQESSVVGLYDPELSVKGALLCASKEKRRIEANAALNFMDVYNPNALPEFRRKNLPWKRRGRFDYEKYRTERKIPQKPVDITGRGVDLINENKTHHLLKDVGRAALAHMDPRDALLKWTDKANDEESKHYLKIYNKSQPGGTSKRGEGTSTAKDGPPQKKRKTGSSQFKVI